MDTTLDGFLAGKDPEAVGAFTRFRSMVSSLGSDVDERVAASEVVWARSSIFASAFVYATYLEVALYLPGRVHHRALREAFPRRGLLTAHRLSIRSPEDFDEPLGVLLSRAYTAAESR